MIKKMLVFISCIVASILVFFTYDAYDQKNAIILGTYQDYVQTITKQEILPLLFEFHDLETIDDTLQTLLRIAKQQDATLVSVTSEMSGALETNKYGIYSFNEDILSYLKSDQTIDLTNIDSIQYLSTDNNDPHRLGTILSLSDQYLINKVYKIGTFSLAKADFIRNSNGMLYIYTSDTNAMTSALTEAFRSQQSVKFTVLEGYSPAQLDKIKAITTAHVLPLFLSCAAIFTILLIVYVTKIKKEILIQRMNGISLVTFIRFKLGKLLSILCCVFTITTLCSFFLLAHQIDILTIDLWKQVLLYPLYFLILMLFVSILLYIYINKTSNLKFLRSNTGSHYALQMNLCMKIILIVFILPTLLTTGLAAFSSFNDYIALTNHREEIEGVVRFDKLNITYPNKQKLFEYYQAHDGRYVDFDNYANNQYDELIKHVPVEHVEEEVIDYPMILANANYLKTHEIKDEHGQLINIEDIEEDTLLIPPAYRDEDLSKSCYSGECKRINIQNPGRFVNYKLENQIYSLHNPLIHVVTKLSDDANIFHMYLPLQQNKNIDIYDKELKELVDGTITLRENTIYIEMTLNTIKTNLYNFMKILGLYLIILVAFIYQYVYLSLSEKLPELSIQYMLGESRLMRYREILLTSLIGYAVPCSIAIIIQKLPMLPVFLSILLFILIEFSIQYVLLKKAEKNNVSNILKGERNV